MRADMAKVVTERPRRGHANRSLKTHATIAPKTITDDGDYGPTRAPVSASRQHGWDAKEFTDVLGPLRGYLRKQVGRPWDAVYSELCTHLDRRSLTGRHIFSHVQWEVEDLRKTTHNQRLFWSPPHNLYIDYDGILKAVKPRRDRVPSWAHKWGHAKTISKFLGRDVEADDALRYRIDTTTADSLLYGEGPVWFRLTYRRHDPLAPVTRRLDGERVTKPRRAWGLPTVELMQKRQLNAKEVRRLRAAGAI